MIYWQWHTYGYDSYAPFQSRPIHTLSVTNRSHPFGYDPITPIFGHEPFTLFRSQPIRNFLITTICTLWSWHVCNFSVTIHSQPFGHDHLHPFSHNPFAPFWSRSRSFPTLSVKINFTSFRSRSIRTLLFKIIGSLSVTAVLYIFGQNTFTSFRSQNVHTPWIMICLYLLDHSTFIPLRLWCVHIS